MRNGQDRSKQQVIAWVLLRSVRAQKQIGGADMHGFIEHLKSPDFVIYGVVMGLVLHIVANYIQRLLDKSLSSGNSLLRGMSRRSRAKQEAREQQIYEWIGTHDNGAVLALTEAHYLALYGLTMLAGAMIGACILLLLPLDRKLSLTQLPSVLIFALLVLIGMTALFTSTRLRAVIYKHPKGLAGLFPDKS